MAIRDTMKKISLACTLFVLLTAACSHAELPIQTNTNTTQAKTYTWKTKNNTLTMWLQAGLTADVTPENSTIENKQRGNNELVVNTPKLKIWRVNTQSNLAIDSKSTSENQYRAGLPVFSDSPNGNGLRVLIGGVIVVLDSSLSKSSVETWLEQRKLKGRPLSIANNAFMVDSPPGFPSLELANQLTKENDESLIIAEPNWWVEHGRR